MLILVDKASEAKDAGLQINPYKQYFIVNAFDLRLKELSDMVAKHLHVKGLAPFPEASSAAPGGKMMVLMCVWPDLFWII